MFGTKMKTNILLDNDAATLVYYPEFGIVHHTIHRGIEDKELQAVLLAGLKVFIENSATKWLSDDRGNSDGLSQEQFEWGQINWTLPMINAGWKYWALVVPDEVSARQDMVAVIDMFYERGIRIMVFTDVERALNWLKGL